MRSGGGSCEPRDIDKQFKVWKGKVLRTGPVRSAATLKTFNTALRLIQGASQASQPGAAAAAAGPPAADGDGGTASVGGGTDAGAIELTRKISAVVAQIEQRNANFEKSLRSPNSKLPPLGNYFKQFASSLPSY